MRIGIVGTENSHVDHLVAHLNQGRDGGARVVALAGGDPERNRRLAEAGIEHLVPDVEALLEVADALIVTDRDGRLHREHALPFLQEGRPVYVDKPLACSMDDARAIVQAARRHHAPLTSSSALRWLPELTELLREELPGLGAIQSVVVIGPADPASEYGGIFFYGIHAVDVALAVAPGPVGQVQVHRTSGAVHVSALCDATLVQVHLVRPTGLGHVPFHVLVIGETGIAERLLPVTGNYTQWALAQFLEMAATGVPPIGYDDLLRPIELLEQVDLALR